MELLKQFVPLLENKIQEKKNSEINFPVKIQSVSLFLKHWSMATAWDLFDR